MEIIIPLAGLSRRFYGSRFGNFKPLVDINGKTMIERAIKTLDLTGKYNFVVTRSESTELLVATLREITHEPNILVIDQVTEGPCCSALLLESVVDPEDELVIANCDQIMNWSGSHFIHSARFFDGAIVTYYADVEHNSYAEVSKQGYVVRVKEKQRISNISLNGIHYWKKGKYFFDSARQMLAANDTAPNGEYYIGPSYNYLISENFKIGIYHVPNQMHNAVGVPEDLERYLTNENLLT